jgi:hypothetical protein
MAEPDIIDVFVSYRWVEPDQVWVRELLVPALRAAGLRVMLDVDDFVPGRDLILEMTRAEQCRFVIAVLSPDYFDGDRLAHFESLMARRIDPGGRTSHLIPLILRPVTIPEWLRGLVPIDWTNPREYTREWKKLLKITNALQSSPPPGMHVHVDHERALEVPQVRAFRTVLSRDGKGFGIDAIIENRSQIEILAQRISLSGDVALTHFGASAVRNWLKYEIEVGTDIESGAATKLRGLSFEDTGEWGALVTGTTEFEEDTVKHLKAWRALLEIPAIFRLLPSERLGLQLRCRKHNRRLVAEQHWGEFIGSYTGHYIRRQLELRVILENGQVITHPLDEEFMRFVFNWSE